MKSRIAQTIVHYGQNDPRTTTGGVETFARNLSMFFDEVLFMTPATRDEALVRNRKLAVVCDNHHVLDWPSDIPVIGFQHGVAARKVLVTHSAHDAKLALRQRKAAKREHTLWVACAQWISRTFARLHGNRAAHVIYHPVDLTRFDGKLESAGSRLLLHDGRSKHKGSELFAQLKAALPDWQVEPLGCKPEEVPDRMRGARAFLHLSRYEGNSIVCNEAMAMDLPCLFTKVGLMNDGPEQFDVQVIDTKTAFAGGERLLAPVREFLDGLATRSYHPRAWSEAHASHAAALASWQAAMDDLHQRYRWGRA